jgi:type II secretory pathway predicted ATPase ExeA
MYETFYGLRERPFELTPNPRYLLMTPRHEEALSTLENAISGRKGVALLLGAAGTGKTTLVRAALSRQRGADVLGVCLDNPALTRQEFMEFLVDGFRLTAAAAQSKTRLLRELRDLLEDRRARGAATAFIIDEAQSLSDELLQEVRLLANIETPTEKLLSVILVGQSDLADRLNQPTMLHVKQRVALRAMLAPLDRAETSAYIDTRIRIAGGDGSPVFTPNAAAVIYKHSGGIPRTISAICDNALVAGFALGQRPVSTDTVIKVCRGLDFAPGAPAARPAAVATEPSAPARTTAMLSCEPRTRPMDDFDSTPADEHPEPHGGASPSAKRLRVMFRTVRRRQTIAASGEAR